MKLIEKEPLSSPVKADWISQSSLIGHPCDLNPKLNGGEIQRGEIVAVPRTGSPAPKFGIIAGKNPNGTYRVIVEKDGTMKELDPEYITRLDTASLSKKANSTPPLSEEEQKALGQRLENNREKLEEILNLFDTVKTPNYSKAELDMINNPFPIVWASVSLRPKRFEKGVEGEHIVQGKAELGEDLQLVFTDRENVDKLQSQVKDHGVLVLSFEAAHFILGKGKENQYQSLWDPLTPEEYLEQERELSKKYS